MSEVWMSIPGIAGAEASNTGKIRNNGRLIALKHRNKKRKYYHVTFNKRCYLAHRLICMAFHGEPPTEKHEVMHLDGDGSNNDPKNLRWGTHAENMAMDRGNNHSHKGEINPNSKLTEENVREIREVYDKRTSDKWGCRKLAKKFGICEKHCRRIAMRSVGGWQTVQ